MAETRHRHCCQEGRADQKAVLSESRVLFASFLAVSHSQAAQGIHIIVLGDRYTISRYRYRAFKGRSWVFCVHVGVDLPIATSCTEVKTAGHLEGPKSLLCEKYIRNDSNNNNSNSSSNDESNNTYYWSVRKGYATAPSLQSWHVFGCCLNAVLYVFP